MILIPLFLIFLLVSCGKQIDVLRKPSNKQPAQMQFPNNTIPPTIPEIIPEHQITIEELNLIYGLINVQLTLDTINDSPVASVGFMNASSYPDTISLDRQLTDLEVTAGADWTRVIIVEYDKILNGLAEYYLNRFISNDLIYSTNCNKSAPFVFEDTNGTTVKIKLVSVGNYGVYIDADNTLLSSGFNSTNRACRSRTSDFISTEYMAEYFFPGNKELLFPVKYKKTGGIGNKARIQSLHGSMKADFCDRTTKLNDGLDNTTCL